jgi:hypothetical protein
MNNLPDSDDRRTLNLSLPYTFLSPLITFGPERATHTSPGQRPGLGAAVSPLQGSNLCFFPYPGRCPGLIYHAPSGLRTFTLKMSKLQSPFSKGGRRWELSPWECIDRGDKLHLFGNRVTEYEDSVIARFAYCHCPTCSGNPVLMPSYKSLCPLANFSGSPGQAG